MNSKSAGSMFYKNGKEIKEGMLLNGGVEYASLWGFPKFQIGNYIDEYLIDVEEEGENKPVKLWGSYLEFQNGDCRGINSEFLKDFEILE